MVLLTIPMIFQCPRVFYTAVLSFLFPISFLGPFFKLYRYAATAVVCTSMLPLSIRTARTAQRSTVQHSTQACTAHRYSNAQPTATSYISQGGRVRARRCVVHCWSLRSAHATAARQKEGLSLWSTLLAEGFDLDSVLGAGPLLALRLQPASLSMSTLCVISECSKTCNRGIIRAGHAAEMDRDVAWSNRGVAGTRHPRRWALAHAVRLCVGYRYP